MSYRYLFSMVGLSVVGLLVCVYAAAHPWKERSRPALRQTASNIEHLVVIIQENISFDAYFGKYCRAPKGAAPTCNLGPDCCEAGPLTDQLTGAAPLRLDDQQLGAFDPNHTSECFVNKINDGKMDRFVKGKCGDPRNFVYAEQTDVDDYWQLAGQYALADRWFHPVVGGSAGNNMYFARAHFVFPDNTIEPLDAVGTMCTLTPEREEYTDLTLGDVLADAGVSWSFYMQGYDIMREYNLEKKACPPPDPLCPSQLPLYPCKFTSSDNPFQYFPRFRDKADYIRDFEQLATDIEQERLPAVVYIKGMGFRTEHPGYKHTISDGMSFVSGVIEQILTSTYADNTLIILTYDESGGYFDHIAPPAASPVDGMPYGVRVPTLAIGRFAKKNYVSHVELEHSSIVKFIEWNWLDQVTGQLGARDAVVNNIGSLLDPEQTGAIVP